MPRPQLKFALLAVFAAVLVISPMAFRASAAVTNDQYDEPEASRVGRVSAVEGDVSLRQSGSEEWQRVDLNTPVFEGDEFYTSAGARIEFQLGGGRYVRADELTDVVFATLEPKAARVEVPTGLAIVSVAQLDNDERFEVSAPAAAVTFGDGGVYRIHVDQNGNTRVGVVRGSARAAGTREAIDVREGETADFNFDDPSDVSVVAVVDYDSFDAWSADLDTQHAQYLADTTTGASSLYYRTDIYGVSDLNGYGSWVNGGSYGSCWVPNNGFGWSPYSNGYWQFYPGYGYSWVSSEPWGWAPYHYGRWAFLTGYGWAWVPWSQFTGGYYSWYPGNVYWYQYPGSPNYYWVPLAPNEPYVAYVRANRRHDRDFVPVHLRAGRGVGLVQNGSGARLNPAPGGKGLGGVGGGRNPVGGAPVPPRNPVDTVDRVKSPVTESIRNRPVVVSELTTTPATLRRPTREAVKETTSVERAPRIKAPADHASAESTPTMVESRPAPRQSPSRTPVLTIEPNSGETVVAKPSTRPNTSRPPKSSQDQPAPVRVKPSEPKPDTTTVDRPAPHRVVTAPPREPSQPRSAPESRPAPSKPSQVQRQPSEARHSEPAPTRHIEAQPAPSSGGGKKGKP
ncbi:MAG TPA: FecR domain-containing protein [Blastocatellia bacterium]|nr:FecR domain-containing protein [Blastocatellia bacterium]